MDMRVSNVINKMNLLVKHGALFSFILLINNRDIPKIVILLIHMYTVHVAVNPLDKFTIKTQ